MTALAAGLIAAPSARAQAPDQINAIQRQINELNARSTVDLGALNHRADRLFDTLFIYENWPKISPDGWQARLGVRMGDEVEKLDYPLSVIVSDFFLTKLFLILF